MPFAAFAATVVLAPEVVEECFRYRLPITEYGPHRWTAGRFYPAPGATWITSRAEPTEFEIPSSIVRQRLGFDGFRVDENEGTVNNVVCDDFPQAPDDASGDGPGRG